ncbi:YbaL family putative K(+) efflux transporter [Uliginosibacterium sp. H1]|uniref:YbaL family putative K(+) efflux transporter n=1 Tax=Uliginosibacterium sp. H1 TaxID=3114757 RepID=UPI002E1862FB|nr:YbaL family putative K(+) efflux transporter [Uliginosibacterium sp. H1]
MHLGPLLATLVGGLVLAFIFGALAHKAKLSPLVGYLLAGVIIGPYTPGFVADTSLGMELSEIGVILLMFGVGLHFSFKDLLAVRNIALPGAVVQIGAATAMGMGLAHFLGWSLAGGFVFGLSLSVASTVVLLRALQERRLVDTERGRIAVGWLIVEDVAMVLALVLIPAIAGSGEEGGFSVPVVLGITVLKVIAFGVFMMVVGRRVIPSLLHWVAHTGSRELFSLSVLAVALGVAFCAATLFGVSFALGAFFAGMILAESTLSHRAAEESLPLRDAFAVLFFVSVGMLFDWRIVMQAPVAVAATLGIIIVGKSIAAYLVVRMLGHKRTTALTISASLAQIGEFSFILAGLGVTLDLFGNEGRDLILAGAIFSILANPFIFSLCERIAGREKFNAVEEKDSDPRTKPIEVADTSLSGHPVIVGYGRVGRMIGERFKAMGQPFVVIEDRDRPADAARADGGFVVFANAANPRALQAANVVDAKWLFVAIPQSFEAGQVVMQAREASPALQIIARSHSDDETTHLMKCGATETIMGEREIAKGMLALSVGTA